MAYADLKNKLDEYNWDDGFEVPRTILADPDCDLALALEIFYLAGGYEYLEKSAKRTKLQKWNPFITVLYEDILEQPHKISTITGTSKPVTTVRRSNGSKRLV